MLVLRQPQISEALTRESMPVLGVTVRAYVYTCRIGYPQFRHLVLVPDSRIRAAAIVCHHGRIKRLASHPDRDEPTFVANIPFYLETG